MRKHLIITLAAFFAFSGAAFADTVSLEERVAALEKAAETDWMSRISLSGLVETEFSYSKTDDGTDETSETDLSLSKVEIGFGVELHKFASAFAVFLYEDEELDVDEGAIVIGNTEEFPVYFQAGKFVVPFGVYETMMITDPYTNDLGEVNRGAALLGFEKSGFSGGVFAFDTDVPEADEDDKPLQFGASVFADLSEYLPEGLGFSFGASYISSMSESGAFEELVVDDLGIDEIDEYVAGYTVFASASFAGVTLIAEYLSTADDFKADYYGTDKDYKPSALNLEAGYTFEYVSEKEMTVAVRYEDVQEAFGADFNTYGGAVSAEIFREKTLDTVVSLAGEYLRRDYDEDGDPKEDIFTVQLSAAF
jgi:hypothetical protein